MTLLPPGLQQTDLKRRMTAQHRVGQLCTEPDNSKALTKAASLSDDTDDSFAPNGKPSQGERDANEGEIAESDGSWSYVPSSSGSSDPGVDLSRVFSITTPYLDWPSLLALRGVCHLIKDAVDDYLTVPELMVEVQPPERPRCLLVYARIGGFDRLLPFFNVGRGSARQMHMLSQATAVSISGRMHRIVNYLLTQLSPSATVFLDLLTGTAECTLELPALHRLVVGEEQILAWGGLALGLHVVHSAREIELRLPLHSGAGGAGSPLDWALGPQLRPTGFSALLQPSVRRLLLGAHGRVAAFLDAVGLLFPSAGDAALRIAVALSTDEWWERVQPNGVVARRVAATFGVRTEQVTVRLQDAGALVRWIRAAAEEERKREGPGEPAAENDTDSVQESVEDWEVDGEWFGKRAEGA